MHNKISDPPRLEPTDNKTTNSYAKLMNNKISDPPRLYINDKHKLKITEGKLAVARARLAIKARNGSKELPKVRRLKSKDLENRGIEEFIFKRFSFLKKSKEGLQNKRILHECTEDLYPLAVELGYSNQIRIFCDHLPKHYEQPSDKADYFTVC